MSGAPYLNSLNNILLKTYNHLRTRWNIPLVIYTLVILQSRFNLERNFSFVCANDYKWRATPAYDITFAKGVKQTKEHKLSLNAKALATEFSIGLKFVSESIMKIKMLRENQLPSLMKKYNISETKEVQVLQAVSKRFSRRIRCRVILLLSKLESLAKDTKKVQKESSQKVQITSLLLPTQTLNKP